MGDNGSIFEANGFENVIEYLCDEIRELYLEDAVPWVIGYSGGKDSTAIVQLVWTAIHGLDPKLRTKPVHIISTDTLVENPVVAGWVNLSLNRLREAAQEQQLPIQAHALTPAVSDTFWVNLIGHGYPAPRNKFRWCTERMKINPSNNFIQQTVRDNGEAILVLGTRKAESARRHATMLKHEERRVRDRLSPNSRLTNCMVYTPIEAWSNDDVWRYLMQVENPWAHSNKNLMGMYRGASADGECPLVVDETTASCGNSRFGCWVCTLVDQDKSMTAMIQNDAEKEWMEPLLDFRNELDFRGDSDRKRDLGRRDFRRKSGKLTFNHSKIDGDRLIRGPYTQEARAYWLRRLLEIEKIVNELAPKEVGAITLIQPNELDEIRRIWISEKHEIEDLLPEIYGEVTGQVFEGQPISDGYVLDRTSLDLLKEASGSEMNYQMARNLLDVSFRYRTQVKRMKLFGEIESIIESCFYNSEQDALHRAKKMHEAKNITLEPPTDGVSITIDNMPVD